ncbi:MAG TPA: adenylate/guanylate cyclase domain-containing protein [Desulfuromonadaceae bacterium]|nr:adenylate/guanylate cyclase domain-containing protein [Desulfuromonadaceae bacterium]
MAALVFVCGLRLVDVDFLERVERATYDLRTRMATRFSAPVAPDLAFVSIEESTINAVRNGSVGFHFGLYWPRQVYGRMVDELSAQGAKTVAFDVLFNELRPDHHALVQMADGSYMTSDDYFAMQLHRAGNVLLADTGDAPLPSLFATNALAIGDVTAAKDGDGVLRRVRAFQTYRQWHPYFEKAAEAFDLDLAAAKIVPGQIIFPRRNGDDVKVPVDEAINVDLAVFDQRLAGKVKAFTDERIWQMGIVMAARELGLDLAHPDIDLARGRIILHGPNGVTRTIPVDSEGFFYIDWELPPNDARLFRAPAETLLMQNFRRLNGETNILSDRFRGKTVIIGSAAKGNDLSDRGATPMERDTLLVSKHWNIANSVITDRFIRRTTLPEELALIVLLGAITGFVTWHMRAFASAAGTFLLAVTYITIAFVVYANSRVWLPIVLPVGGAMLVEHLVLVAYRAVFEEGEKRRVRSVFSRIVAPDIVDELLHAEKLALGGGRREVTVYFADVRGFTEFTDQSQAKVLEYVRSHNLTGAKADEAIDQEARETLNTVNLYLGTLADIIKRYNGTLDKYIGDCVMAFWGAPVSNEKHAAACVRAAVDAQRAVYQVNLQRIAENHKRELENLMSGELPKPKLPILMMGSGVNTGMVTVGLMGSNEHLLNYTVFGREVNLASRLEAVSGRGRIIISETTYQHLLRDDPDLAKTCVALPPVKVKGIVAEVKIYEVPWRPENASPFDEELFSPSKPAEGTSFTGIVQREG